MFSNRSETRLGDSFPMLSVRFSSLCFSLVAERWPECGDASRLLGPGVTVDCVSGMVMTMGMGASRFAGGCRF